MSLVGSSTSQVKNFASAASLSAADVDETLAAFVEQIGGVKWLNGVSARVAGNLTYDNFGSVGALPNSYKREPRSRFSIPLTWNSLSMPSGAFYIGSFVAPAECLFRGAGWCYIGPVGGLITLNVDIAGVRVISTIVDVLSDPSTRIKALSAPLAVAAGDIVSVHGVSTATGTDDCAISCCLEFGAEHA